MNLKNFLISFAIFMAIDLVWLGVVAEKFYSDQLGDLMAEAVVWPAAIVFYILFVVGLMYFAINPGLQKKSLNLAVKNGALFGFFTYMTYELTNWAVIEGWPAQLVLVDILWGVVLASLVSWLSYKVLSRNQ